MKRFTIGLLVLLFAVTAGLLAQEVTVIKVKVQSANVRSEPDMNAAVVRQVKLGTLLESRQKVGEWFEVTITDERGNVMSGFINVTVVDVVGGGAKPGGQAGGQQVEVKKPAEGGAPTIIVQQQVQQAQANTQTNVQTQANAGGDSGMGGGAGGGFKIMGGMGMANMTFDAPDADTQTQIDKYKKSKSGLAGGIGLAMGSRIGFEFDLMYLQKGARFQGTDNSQGQAISFDATININMISVPVLLRFNILNSPTAPALYALGGAEIAYIFEDGKMTYTVTQAGQTQKGTEKLPKKNMNQIDYGAVFGGGIGINMGGVQIFLEGRYHLGMANIMKNADGTEAEGADNVKPKTSLLLLMAGFKF